MIQNTVTSENSSDGIRNVNQHMALQSSGNNESG